MANETFNFCPNSLVPVTVPPEAQPFITMNGWAASARPNIPYQKRFKVTLHGLRWYLDGAGLYDVTSNPTTNARALELFYERHGVWRPFNWTHPHMGALVVTFQAPVTVPAAMANSAGLIDPLEINLLHYNPGF